jgi:hypothetical protein
MTVTCAARWREGPASRVPVRSRRHEFGGEAGSDEPSTEWGLLGVPLMWRIARTMQGSAPFGCARRADRGDSGGRPEPPRHVHDALVHLVQRDDRGEPFRHTCGEWFHLLPLAEVEQLTAVSGQGRRQPGGRSVESPRHQHHRCPGHRSMSKPTDTIRWERSHHVGQDCSRPSMSTEDPFTRSKPARRIDVTLTGYSSLPVVRPAGGAGGAPGGVPAGCPGERRRGAREGAGPA